MGASVRGAIDLVRIERELQRLRDDGDSAFEDAAIAALSGRLHLEEGCEKTPEAIVRELIAGLGRPTAPLPPPRRGGP
jgi:MoxR-like ATPase